VPIRVLAPDVVAGISAGEVIERPASVVKELVENALDAGAAGVRVDIEAGGMGLIRVADDGGGMAGAEAALAFRRHATSKLAALDDLGKLSTYGFRGEALAAIAAAADVEMLTRTKGSDEGTRISAVFGEESITGPAGCAKGTEIRVRNLFLRMPARLKFMRSPRAENAAILRVIEPYILARPRVRFVLTVDGEEKLNAIPSAEGSPRIRAVMGDAADCVLPFSSSSSGNSVRGFTEAPGKVHGRGRQWLVVNGRPVEDRGLRHALIASYSGQIPREAWPWAVVFVDVPPDRLDVNVHPAKSEVKFADQRQVYDLIAGAIREAFRTVHTAAPAAKPSSRAGTTPAMSEIPLPLESSEGSPRGGEAFVAQPSPRWSSPSTAGGAVEILGQFHETYIAARLNGNLVLVDQHAAHEKVIFSRLLTHSEGASQQLLIPLTIELSPAEAALAEEYRVELGKLGYEYDGLGGRTVALRGVPAGCGPSADAAAVLRGVLSDAGSGTGATDEPVRKLAASVACHSAVKAGDRLEPREMEALLLELLALEDPGSCPHGRPTMVTWDTGSLARLFKRP